MVALLLTVGCDPAPSPTAGPEPPTSQTTGAKTPEAASAGATASLSPTTSSSAPAAPTTSASTGTDDKQSSCAPGAYRHRGPRFCLLLPEGYKPSPVKSAGDIIGVLFRSQAPGTMDLEVTWVAQPRSVYRQERDRLKEAAKADPKAVIGTTRGGKGTYVSYRGEMGGKQVAYGQSVLYRKGTIFWCKAQAFSEPPPPEGFLTACKSLNAR